MDILRYVVNATKGVVQGLNWSRCPLAQEVDDEDTKAEAGDTEARGKVMSGEDIVEARKAALAQEKQEAEAEARRTQGKQEEVVETEGEVDWGGDEDDAEEGVVVEEVDLGDIEGGSIARGSGDGVPPPTRGALTRADKRDIGAHFDHIKDYCRNGAPDVKARSLLPPAQVGGSGVIAVHIHCLRRGFQLRQSLLWNLFVCSPFGCFHFL